MRRAALFSAALLLLAAPALAGSDGGAGGSGGSAAAPLPDDCQCGGEVPPACREQCSKTSTSTTRSASCALAGGR